MGTEMANHETRLAYSLEVLAGLSVGDALGEALSYRHYRVRELMDFSQFHDGTVRYTDDTEMASAIVETLSRTHSVDPDLLASAFAIRFQKDPDRGYGRMARKLLREISAGADWREISKAAFNGGSFGNGAAMRVATLGAYFFDSPEQVTEMARNSAIVTHHHPEGIAGAIAVATAACTAIVSRDSPADQTRDRIWETVMNFTPSSTVRNQIGWARQHPDSDAKEVARTVGCGFEISAQDTVPFCIWNACRHIDDYAEALISTIEVGGDCDTNAAIVGGITCAFVGQASIPPEWLRVREPLRLSA